MQLKITQKCVIWDNKCIKHGNLSTFSTSYILLIDISNAIYYLTAMVNCKTL